MCWKMIEASARLQGAGERKASQIVTEKIVDGKLDKFSSTVCSRTGFSSKSRRHDQRSAQRKIANSARTCNPPLHPFLVGEPLAAERNIVLPY